MIDKTIEKNRESEESKEKPDLSIGRKSYQQNRSKPAMEEIKEMKAENDDNMS